VDPGRLEGKSLDEQLTHNAHKVFKFTFDLWDEVGDRNWSGSQADIFKFAVCGVIRPPTVS
jgi:hypothetical protein